MTKLTLQQVSTILSNTNTIVVEKDEIFDDITQMTGAIYPCPRRNARRRSYDQVFNDCSRIAIEYALAKILGGERNPNEWDMYNPETFRWDVRVDDTYFEVKRHALGTKWFSYPDDGMKTFRKYASTLDYFVSGYMETYGDAYIVDFALVANAKTFFNYFMQSKFPRQLPYFNHDIAKKYGQCDIINMRECTYKGNN